MTYELNLENEKAKFESALTNVHEIIGTTELPVLGETRGETQVPEDLSADQIEQLYDVMASFGFGRESDLSAEEAGMQNGYLAVIEGGKPNKVTAELNTVLESGVEHGPIVFTASKDRKIGQDELDMLQSWGITNDGIETEVQMVMRLIASNDSIDHTIPRQIAFGYDVMSGETAKDEESGQAVVLGRLNGQPVYVLTVDRAYDTDDTTNYKQPSTADMLCYAIELAGNDNQTVDQAAIVTGGLYGATRSIDALQANKRLANSGSSIIAGTIAYGRDTMASVTGLSSARPAAKQLISEVVALGKKADTLNNL